MKRRHNSTHSNNNNNNNEASTLNNNNSKSNNSNIMNNNNPERSNCDRTNSSSSSSSSCCVRFADGSNNQVYEIPCIWTKASSSSSDSLITSPSEEDGKKDTTTTTTKTGSSEDIKLVDPSTIWYTKTDYENRKKVDGLLVQGIIMGTVPDSVCTRGLESKIQLEQEKEQQDEQRYTSYYSDNDDDDDVDGRKQNKGRPNGNKNKESAYLSPKSSTSSSTITSPVLDAVLTEQNRQRQNGYLDAEEIAAACRAYSERSQQEALERGLKDSLVVTMEHDGTLRCSCSSATGDHNSGTNEKGRRYGSSIHTACTLQSNSSTSGSSLNYNDSCDDDNGGTKVDPPNITPYIYRKKLKNINMRLKIKSLFHKVRKIIN